MKAKTAAVLTGFIFILAGALGCTSTSSITYTDPAHNMVHIISGALLLFFGLVLPAYASRFLKWFGVVYFFMGVLGLLSIGIMGMGQWTRFLHVNEIYNFLHMGFAVIIFLAGSLLPKTRQPAVFYSSL
jgi:hypothetical protein